jgi:hypothetical protein
VRLLSVSIAPKSEKPTTDHSVWVRNFSDCSVLFYGVQPEPETPTPEPVLPLQQVQMQAQQHPIALA